MELAKPDKNKFELHHQQEILLDKEKTLQSQDRALHDVMNIKNLEVDLEQSEVWYKRIKKVICDLRTVLTSLEPPPSVVSQPVVRSEREEADDYIRLPKFELEKFSGKEDQWAEFWACFSLSVHNKKMPSAMKLVNLKRSLTGAARELLVGVDPRETDSYDIAVKLLEDEYGSTCNLKTKYVKLISNPTPIQRTNDLTGLRKLYNDTNKYMRLLTVLGISASNYEFIACDAIVKALPEPMKSNFSTSHVSDWKLTEVLSYIKNQIAGQRRIIDTEDPVVLPKTESKSKPAFAKNKPKKVASRSPKETSTESTAAMLTTSVDRCLFCDDVGHTGESCTVDLSKRKEHCRKRGLCYRCLQQGHLSSGCTSQERCEKCSRRHHSWLCDGLPPIETPKTAEVETRTHSVSGLPSVILQTVVVEATGNARTKKIRCFLDGGSEATFISSQLIDELGLSTIDSGPLHLRSFGIEAPRRQDVRSVKLQLRHINNPEIAVNITAIEIPYLTKIPQKETSERLNELLRQKNISISNREPVVEDEIHLLIGNDFYWRIANGQFETITTDLKACNTIFGWTLAGRLETTIAEANVLAISINNVTIREETNELLKKFWDLDAIGISTSSKSFTNDDLRVAERFNETTKVSDGFYEVRLPWTTDPNELDNNQDVAAKRFLGLTRKLRKNVELYERYNEVLQNQLNEGIIEEVPANELTSRNTIYYLPHRPVIKENRLTTKIRIVFDASSHDRGCLSLNDCLSKGPSYLPLIVDLLQEFRRGRFAVTADIQQAFHRVKVHPEDRDVMRFFWVQDGWTTKEPVRLRTLRSTRVMFGTTASPFLLHATIQFHLDTEEKRFPDTCAQLRRHMYVDDLVVSLDDDDDAETLFHEAKMIMKSANMNLVKWRTNSNELRDVVSVNEDETISDLTKPTKVLGLCWNPVTDEMSLDFEEIANRINETPRTKRQLIQTTATLFDPLGFVDPFAITAKILFQRTWKEKLKWDDDLTDEIRTTWLKWCDDVSMLRDIKVPRRIGTMNANDAEFHVFCDASPLAYGTAIYLKTTIDDEIQTNLCRSKARVAPAKELTLPRLELMAALIGSRVVANLKTMYSTARFICWTDSLITLWWIRNAMKKKKPFITARVEEILTTTEIDWWRHCPGVENPADLLTRGISASKLINSSSWWTGPPWLRQDEEHWPTTDIDERTDDHDTNEITTSMITVETAESLFNIRRFGKLQRLIRTTAYVLRFIRILRTKTRDPSPLTIEEIAESERYWIKFEQRSAFAEDIARLQTMTLVPVSKCLQGTRLRIDDDEILRVNTRIKNSELSPEVTEPIVIPNDSHLANLIIWDCHRHVGHGGVSDTLSQLRSKFWIPRGRSVIMKQLKTCFLCRRIHQRKMTGPMADLPAERLRPTHPFDVTGVDFAGPLYLRNGQKTYICLFTCANTRGVHLELVNNMSAETFILAFKRFIGRRVVPTVMYSDNAKTFKRADQELRTMFDVLKTERIQIFATSHRIRWSFIVEHAPWWGGFWERLVRSVKTSLKRILGNAKLNEDELITALVECDALINSRPITYVYTEPQEPDSLTPAHFLTGRRLLNLPDTRAEVVEVQTELVKRWRHRQKQIDGFWQRWSKEYLTELRSHHTRPNSRPIREDDVVLIEDINRSRWAWKIGRVKQVIIGRDGNIRACELQLGDRTTINRAIERLCLLEANDETSRDTAGGAMC